ncbi:hypothetical protein FNV43_RR23871 [Rhamnella rubrinervis]|uniref:Uncharacterized protein n=1 Tax=Rhamnella rubrinervis TaxID=2594499 RepID=A0A8K0DRE9_9ROSA|nr:hypothetical protein FNV43_RR23871 [Rhamnella rubrinervis]
MLWRTRWKLVESFHEQSQEAKQDLYSRDYSRKVIFYSHMELKADIDHIYGLEGYLTLSQPARPRRNQLGINTTSMPTRNELVFQMLTPAPPLGTVGSSGTWH